jgi:hypothetical protein
LIKGSIRHLRLTFKSNWKPYFHWQIFVAKNATDSFIECVHWLIRRRIFVGMKANVPKQEEDTIVVACILANDNKPM